MRWRTGISGVLVSGRLPMVSNGPSPTLTMTVVNRSRRRPGMVLVSILRSVSGAIPRSGSRSVAAPAGPGRPNAPIPTRTRTTTIDTAHRFAIGNSFIDRSVPGRLRRVPDASVRPRLHRRDRHGRLRVDREAAVGAASGQLPHRPHLPEHALGVDRHPDLAAF